MEAICYILSISRAHCLIRQLTLIHICFFLYFIPLTPFSPMKWKCSLAPQWKSQPLKHFTVIRLASQTPMPIKPHREEEQELKPVTSHNLSSTRPFICTDAWISQEKNKTRLQEHNKNPRAVECFLTKIEYEMNGCHTSYWWTEPALATFGCFLYFTAPNKQSTSKVHSTENCLLPPPFPLPGSVVGMCPQQVLQSLVNRNLLWLPKRPSLHKDSGCQKWSQKPHFFSER